MDNAHDFRGQKGLPSSIPHFSLKATLSVTARRRAAHGFTGAIELRGTHFPIDAPGRVQAAMEMNHFFSPALFMKVVNVLGYDCQLGYLMRQTLSPWWSGRLVCGYGKGIV
jgi:hypothetical protein